ncbi:MAG TPA: beta-phosphoglucomutase [Spirochaetia bacterium]|nr:beta-phosphoglucomutase [Spirochaetia bacterium]
MADGSRPAQPYIEAVIYDLDGVLVSTDEYHFRAWKRLADDENIAFDHTINERLRGVSRMESLSIILERSKRIYSGDEKRSLAERKNGYYVESLGALGSDAILPGATETVRALHLLGLRQAVASSSRNAPLILGRTGLSSLFDAAIDGSMITRSKPDPEVFLKAAQALGVAASACVVVEDAVSGVEAAVAAGMRAFAVASAARAAGNIASDNTAAAAWMTAPDLSGNSLVQAVRPFVRAPGKR